MILPLRFLCVWRWAQKVDRANVFSYFAGKMKCVTRLTSKGQVVIPKALRERLQWRAGMRLQVEEMAGGAVCLRVDREDVVEQVCGFLTGGDPIKALEAKHRAGLGRHARSQRRS